MLLILAKQHNVNSQLINSDGDGKFEFTSDVISFTLDLLPSVEQIRRFIRCWGIISNPPFCEKEDPEPPPDPTPDIVSGNPTSSTIGGTIWEQRWGLAGEITGGSFNPTGSIVALNQEGTRLVTGGSSTLKIYDFFSSWELTSDLSNEFTDMVEAVDLTSDGKYVACSEHIPNSSDKTVKVYELGDDGTYKKVGFDLNTDTPGDGFGASISIAEDAKKIAVGAPIGNRVDVIFLIIGEEWTLDLNGPNGGSEFGASVSLAGNGNTLAIGAPNDALGKGSVHMIDINLREITQTINGDLADGRIGSAVALSEDSSTLAIGGEDSYAQIFRLDLTGYIPSSLKISTEASTIVLSISEKGEKVAMGMPLNSDEGQIAGKSYIYQRDSNSHQPIQFFSGEGEENFSGGSVSLSGSGSVLAIGAEFGNVRVWEQIAV